MRGHREGIYHFRSQRYRPHLESLIPLICVQVCVSAALGPGGASLMVLSREGSEVLHS